MPAASTKPENKASSEAGDPIKQVILVMDKKVRNLEKRKGKLDTYKDKQNSGVALEKDQQAAVDKYGEVLQNLEFARELQKHFLSINSEAEKFLKKQAKREKLERQAQELQRIKEMLKLQNLLDNLGSEKVREDFKSGKHGAVVLTEENLKNLDELYKLISPSRDGDLDYQEQLSSAAEHVVSLIDAKEKAVVGTTYKEMKTLIDWIGNCGYFENAPLEEEGGDDATGEQEFDVICPSEVPDHDSAEVRASLPPKIEQQLDQNNTTSQISAQQQQQQQPDLGSIAEADSYFSKPPSATTQQQTPGEQQQQTSVPFSRQRPFQEIVSEVQGSFNFLQESTIDMESPHMDPAVVAAHPMPSAPPMPSTQQTVEASSLPSQTYTGQTFSDLQQQQLSSQQQHLESSQSAKPSEQSSSLLSKQQTVASLAGPDYTSQTFAQSSLSQGLQSDSLFQPPAVEDNNSQISQSVMGQSVSDTTISQFELPPQIPMPPGHDTVSKDSQSTESQVEKKFQMNPNAGVFQSQLFSAAVDESQQQAEYGQQQHGEYGQSGYQGGFRGNRSGNSNYRGRGSRSGDRGGVSNGYSGRGRGGSGYSGNRGGFQNYPPRNDYRSDGFQGYNGNSYNNNGSGFQKRGGPPRGGPRGGGPPRGGPPRGNTRGRGGNSAQGGFGRPSQQQPVA